MSLFSSVIKKNEIQPRENQGWLKQVTHTEEGNVSTYYFNQ